MCNNAAMKAHSNLSTLTPSLLTSGKNQHMERKATADKRTLVSESLSTIVTDHSHTVPPLMHRLGTSCRISPLNGRRCLLQARTQSSLTPTLKKFMGAGPALAHLGIAHHAQRAALWHHCPYIHRFEIACGHMNHVSSRKLAPSSWKSMLTSGANNSPILASALLPVAGVVSSRMAYPHGCVIDAKCQARSLGE